MDNMKISHRLQTAGRHQTSLAALFFHNFLSFVIFFKDFFVNVFPWKNRAKVLRSEEKQVKLWKKKFNEGCQRNHTIYGFFERVFLKMFTHHIT